MSSDKLLNHMYAQGTHLTLVLDHTIDFSGCFGEHVPVVWAQDRRNRSCWHHRQSFLRGTWLRAWDAADFGHDVDLGTLNPDDLLTIRWMG